MRLDGSVGGVGRIGYGRLGCVYIFEIYYRRKFYLQMTNQVSTKVYTYQNLYLTGYTEQ